MKIRLRMGFVITYHVLASLIFGGLSAIGVYFAVQNAQTNGGIGAIIMASQFGAFFLTIQILAFLFYAKAERFPVVIEGGVITIRAFKRGKTTSFPVSKVASWGFLWVRDGSKGVSFITKDGKHNVASPIVTPSPENRTRMAELIGIKESR
jgi:hypothetical protein